MTGMNLRMSKCDIESSNVKTDIKFSRIVLLQSDSNLVGQTQSIEFHSLFHCTAVVDA